MTIETLQLAWRCPSCQAPLLADQRQWRCDNNHSFDISRQGHVNLLLAHHKRSRNPGDARAMLQARQRFLQRGFYQPLVREMAGLINRHAAPGDRPRALLDAGCGEGYYLRELAGLLPDSWRYGGFDIAKDAVLMAARANRRQEYVCASSKNIPLADATVDCVVSVFAPVRDAEVTRVLRPGGLLLMAGPGPGHLLEIRQAIYREVQEHAEIRSPAGCERVAAHHLAYPCTLHDAEAWADLLSMTPFLHRGDPAARSVLLNAPPERLSCDFQLALFRKPGRDGAGGGAGVGEKGSATDNGENA